MNQLKFLVTLLIFTILNSSALSQNDSTVAATELQRMNNTFGYRIKMNITKEGRIESLPNQEIQLSLAELKQISPVTRKDIRFYTVRFIVAHEFAHQMQYYRYANEPKFMNSDLVSKTLIETQADILAGLIFFQISPEILVYQGSAPQLVNDIFKELFVVTHNMGISENTLGSHPSKRDRMLAVRLGLTNGFSFTYDQWVKSDTIRAIQNGITYPIFKKQMHDQFRYINLDNAIEDMISWSYRQAKKIVNYDRNIATGIVLLTPLKERVIWHEDISNPYVEYKLTYKNISTKNIDIEMEVFVAHVNRLKSDTPESYRKVNVEHYKFSILPGQSKTIKGKLLWLKNENDVFGNFELRDIDMPRIVYPGMSSDGIYSCSYTNDLSNKVYQENIANINFPTSSGLNDFRTFYYTILNTCGFNYQDAIKGMGQVNLNYPDEITYVSSIQFEDETLTLVNVDSMNKISSIEIFFQNYYPQANSILTKYIEIKKILNMELNDSKIEEGQIGEKFWVNYSSKESDVYLQTIKNDATKQYTVKLLILFN